MITYKAVISFLAHSRTRILNARSGRWVHVLHGVICVLVRNTSQEEADQAFRLHAPVRCHKAIECVLRLSKSASSSLNRVGGSEVRNNVNSVQNKALLGF